MLTVIIYVAKHADKVIANSQSLMLKHCSDCPRAYIYFKHKIYCS